MDESSMLIFPERRVDGAFPVRGGKGTILARIEPAWSGGRFTVTAPDGMPIGAGATTHWWSSGTWNVSGAGGEPILTVTAKPLRNSATVRLERGGELSVHGSPWRRDFAVADADDRVVLSAVPRTSPLSPHQYDYAVELPVPGALGFFEAVAIVQVWRMMKQSDVAVVAATSTAVVTPG